MALRMCSWSSFPQRQPASRTRSTGWDAALASGVATEPPRVGSGSSKGEAPISFLFSGAPSWLGAADCLAVHHFASMPFPIWLS